MNSPVLSLAASACLAALAVGRVDAAAGDNPDAVAVPEAARELPSGPSFHPLLVEDLDSSPVPVPEPVLASIIAAGAVLLLRRARP